ncbi:MAG: hypothetical protein ACXW1E_08765 [Halobacteriota archaeon]
MAKMIVLCGLMCICVLLVGCGGSATAEIQPHTIGTPGTQKRITCLGPSGDSRTYLVTATTSAVTVQGNAIIWTNDVSGKQVMWLGTALVEEQ